MTPTAATLIALAAAAIGAAIAYLFAHSRGQAVIARLEERTREADTLRARAADCDAARATVARLEAELGAERRASEEKVALLDDAGVRLRDAFSALSADALHANNKQFLELATTSLSKFQESAQVELATREKAVADLVKPIEDGLKRVDDKLGAVEKERVDAYATLKAHVETMKESQLQLQTETHNLVRALRTPHIRGSWGEIQLRRVVEMAGMLEHCDFDEQVSTESDGGRLRPDLVIHLPAGKTIIVDSKAPLSAYLQSVEASEDDARSTLLVQHARQVRAHITQLAGKDYARQFDSAPDFVVMFLPGESFFSAACQCDPGLIDYAIDHQVIPASPTTLITLLRTIQFGWRQERIAQNAAEISKLGRELYDRLRTFATHMDGVGKGLRRAVESFNGGVGSLETRVLVSARKFNSLGIGGEEMSIIESLDLVPRDVQAQEISAILAPVSQSGDGTALPPS